MESDYRRSPRFPELVSPTTSEQERKSSGNLPAQPRDNPVREEQTKEGDPTSPCGFWGYEAPKP